MADFGDGISKTSIPTFDPASLVLIGRDEGDESSEGWDPRVKWEPQDWMIESIDLYGVLTPVIIKKMSDGRFKVLDGRQRVINTRAVNDARVKRGSDPIKIRCVVVSDKDDIEIGNVANGHRTPDSPMIVAWKMDRAMLRRSLGAEDRSACIPQVAKEFHVSIPTVKNKLALLKCSQAVMEAITDLRISETVAKKLSVLPCDEQDEALEKILGGKKKAKGSSANAEADEAAGGRGKKRKTQARVLKRNVIEAELARLNKPGAQDSIDRPQPSTIAEGMRVALGWVLGRKIDKDYGLGVSENVSKKKTKPAKKDKPAKKAKPAKKPAKKKESKALGKKVEKERAKAIRDKAFRAAVNGPVPAKPKADPRPKKKRLLTEKAASVVDLSRPDPLQDDGMVEDTKESAS
jgi:ParB-like chromosome segregation protein Spo0J